MQRNNIDGRHQLEDYNFDLSAEDDFETCRIKFRLSLLFRMAAVWTDKKEGSINEQPGVPRLTRNLNPCAKLNGSKRKNAVPY